MKSAIEAIRDSSGKLPAYTSFGCYPLVYLSRKGDVLCATCADATTRDVDCDDPVVDGGVHWEGEPHTCDCCGEEIESAYGPPEES